MPFGKPLPLVGLIRDARPGDAEAVIAIYSPHVLDSSATFDVEIPLVEDIRARILANSKLGWLVFEFDGKVIGYAYASKHRERKAYQWCCEVSVYIDEAFQRYGVAAALYRRLIPRLRRKGFVNAYAGITIPNDRSVAFHESMGFRHIGTYPGIAQSGIVLFSHCKSPDHINLRTAGRISIRNNTAAFK